MNRTLKVAVLLIATGFLAVLPTVSQGEDDNAKSDRKRIQKGFEIAPVRLTFKNQDRDLVGLGSYIVNAQAVCADCHSCPSYAPGHNPYDGVGDGQINATNYLAGGVNFGIAISKNLTPDASGMPAGLTEEQFMDAIRTGHDPEDDHILKVMPCSVFRDMVDRDLYAVYQFLSAIPHAEPGECAGPGQ